MDYFQFYLCRFTRIPRASNRVMELGSGFQFYLCRFRKGHGPVACGSSTPAFNSIYADSRLSRIEGYLNGKCVLSILFMQIPWTATTRTRLWLKCGYFQFYLCRFISVLLKYRQSKGNIILSILFMQILTLYPTRNSLCAGASVLSILFMQILLGRLGYSGV